MSLGAKPSGFSVRHARCASRPASQPEINFQTIPVRFAAGIGRRRRPFPTSWLLRCAVVFAVMAPACAPRGQKPTSASTPGSPSDTASAHVALDTIVGTIRRVELEGGFWGLFSDDGERYDPTGSLPPVLQKEGIRVRVVAARRAGVATFRMWGTMVDVRLYEVLVDTAR